MIYFRTPLRLIINSIIHFNEPCDKVEKFVIKIRSPTKRASDSFIPDKSRRTLFESTGDGTSKSSMGNPMKIVESIPTDPKVKNYVKVEWSLVYSEENGVLLLIFAKSEGKGKLEQGKMFTYGRLRNVDYEDSESSNLLLDVQTTAGLQQVVVDENYLVPDCCSPKVLRKDIQTKNNLIVALRPYVIGELMVAQAETPPKKSRKSNPENKKYQKRHKPNEEEEEIIEFVEEEEEEEQELEVVAPGGHLSSGVLSSEQNRIRENIAKNKLVRKGQLFHLPICSIHRPPVDPESGRSPLEIREPHAVHV